MEASNMSPSHRSNATFHNHFEFLELFLINQMLELFSFLSMPYLRLKPLVDFFAAAAGLILFSPFLLTVILLVWITSRGPVLYSQTRVGKNGKHFIIYKFRTMHIDAEKESGPIWASKNDTRVTSIGKFLRKSHIDELPQLINVLKGEMSIVGPRPERPIFVEKFIQSVPNYNERLSGMPGIPGLAQVRHSGDESIEDVVRKLSFDLDYLRNIRFSNDLKIFFQTIYVVLRGVKLGDQPVINIPVTAD